MFYLNIFKFIVKAILWKSTLDILKESIIQQILLNFIFNINFALKKTIELHFPNPS